MDSLHSFRSKSETTGLTIAPPPSFSSLQVPNVLVTPPEEEHGETPPWLLFDASKASQMSTEPDMESLDIALDIHQQIENNAPVFQRVNTSEETIIMPRRNGVAPRQRRPISRDDDVVEIIKVKKNEGMPAPGSENQGGSMSRSKTFKARATKALRSIKNAGKSTRKPAVQEEVWSVTEMGENVKRPLVEEPVPSIRRNLSKRASRPLAQLFTFGRDDPPPHSSKSPTPPHSPRSESRPLSPSSTYTSPLTPSSSRGFDTLPLSTGLSQTTKRSNSFRKRLSMIELPRLFTSSSNTTESTPESTTSTSSETSTISSPTTPKSHNTMIPSLYKHQSSSDNCILSHLNDPENAEDDEEEEDYGIIDPVSRLSMVREDDLAGEIQLDSFHFDSLSFDANDFTVTSLRNGHLRNSEPISAL